MTGETLPDSSKLKVLTNPSDSPWNLQRTPLPCHYSGSYQPICETQDTSASAQLMHVQPHSRRHGDQATHPSSDGDSCSSRPLGVLSGTVARHQPGHLPPSPVIFASQPREPV
ncbi:hypothetical protein H920_17166 [Fukomys damarensis]|uniref:Uncharacterized protein n=1 Tax=Fukomys damarensis TaxID=885580 RepID=A0A091CV06_FUKDA|nr:hypothetical protein H920_17166 [Fukomys damarensis]